MSEYQEQQIENCNGFRFCTFCESLCLPQSTGQTFNEIIFKCNQCGPRTFIIGNEDDRTIKLNRMFYSEAADINDPELGKDPSMPRTQRTCPWCGYDEAVYYYKAGPEQKNIVIQYICNSENCKVVFRKQQERTRYWTKEDEIQVDEEEEDQNDQQFEDDDDMDL